MSLTIVADQNITDLDTYFACIGDIVKVDGRQITPSLLKKVDILLVRSVTRVDRALLANTPIRFVGSATTGTDHLDTDYFSQASIHWAHAPGSNANAVVDYVLSAFCRIEGLLDKLLNGATVGIVGMGNIGSRLYQRLHGLGIQCLAYDPLIKPDSYPILTDFNSVLAANVVSLHTPLTKIGDYPTYHLLDHRQLMKLVDNAVLLNAGRGAVINNQALYDFLGQRRDVKVVLDVWENEPNIHQSLMDRVQLATPHIAGYSDEGKRAGTKMLQAACCRALGLSVPKTSKSEPDFCSLLLDKMTPIESLRQAILSCYDILQDDQTMRSALKTSSQTADIFDKLRKNYPARHEFSYYRPSGEQTMDAQLVKYLYAAGFRACSH